MEHLTREQIDRYAARTAGVDEILAVAQHLDSCDDCRDRAAALIDDGTGERSHVRRRLAPAPPIVEPAPPSRSAALWWVILAIGLAVAAIVILWVR